FGSFSDWGTFAQVHPTGWRSKKIESPQPETYIPGPSADSRGRRTEQHSRVRVAGQTEKLQAEFYHVFHSTYPVPSSKQVLPWVSPVSPRCSPSSDADSGWWSSPPGSLSCRSSR